MGHSQTKSVKEVDPIKPLEVSKAKDSYYTSHYTVYSGSIEILTAFWRENVERMSDEEYTQTAMLFFVNVFRGIPGARLMFSSSKRTMLGQARTFFGMFGWWVGSLKQENKREQNIKKLRHLGVLHQRRGVKAEYYPQMLSAFHETMEEQFAEKYNLRVRFCFSTLYKVMADVMLDQDFGATRNKMAAHKLHLRSLEDCLRDAYTRGLLELFMHQKFCGELMSFYSDYRQFRSCTMQKERNEVGARIKYTYIDEDGKKAINVSGDASKAFQRQLERNGGDYSPDAFDKFYSEVLFLIRNSVWMNFLAEVSLFTEEGSSLSKPKRQSSSEIKINYSKLKISRSQRNNNNSNNTKSMSLPVLEQSLSSPVYSTENLYTI